MSMIIRQRPIFRPTYSASGGGGGSATDGSNYNLTSAQSITTAPSIEDLGGLGGPIASGTNNTHFTRSGWVELYAGLSDWYYSNGQTLNRSLSLLYDGAARGESTSPGGNARGTYQFDVGAAGWKKCFRTIYYYWNWPHPSATQTQWKLQRWQQQMDGSQPEVVDGNRPSGYMSSHQNYDNFFFNVYATGGAGDTSSINDLPAHVVPRNSWFRFDNYMEENSVPSAADGVIRLTMTEISNPSNTWTINKTNVQFRGPSDNSNVFRYAIYQNYLGNSAELFGPWEDSTIYMENLMIQWLAAADSGSTLTYWEMTDASTVAASSKAGVVQRWVSRSGTSCVVRIDKGHWSSTSGKYLLERNAATGAVITTVGPLT